MVLAPAPRRRTRSSSRPRQRAARRCASSRARSSLRFSEPVEGNFGAVRVFDSASKRVDDGQTVHPGGRASKLETGLQAGLADGTYVATYRVISADSHPISGGLVFSVGTPGAAAAPTVAELIGDTRAGPVTEGAFGVARGLTYLATALLLGGLVFLLCVWLPASALDRAERASSGPKQRRPACRPRGDCCSARRPSAPSPASPASSCRARPPARRAPGRRSSRASPATCSARASARCGRCASSPSLLAGRALLLRGPAALIPRATCAGAGRPPRSGVRHAGAEGSPSPRRRARARTRRASGGLHRARSGARRARGRPAAGRAADRARRRARAGDERLDRRAAGAPARAAGGDAPPRGRRSHAPAGSDAAALLAARAGLRRRAAGDRHDPGDRAHRQLGAAAGHRLRSRRADQDRADRRPDRGRGRSTAGA